MSRFLRLFFLLLQVVLRDFLTLGEAYWYPLMFLNLSGGEAVLTAVYTINRTPSSVTHNLSPYERLYGVCPDYSNLRVFGSACFVMLQPHERTKLEPRSRLCYFVGYGIQHKGYRCYDPISRRLRISRHVMF